MQLGGYDAGTPAVGAEIGAGYIKAPYVASASALAYYDPDRKLQSVTSIVGGNLTGSTLTITPELTAKYIGYGASIPHPSAGQMIGTEDLQRTAEARLSCMARRR